MPNVRDIIGKSQANQTAAGSVLSFPKNIAKYGMLFMFQKYDYNSTNRIITFTGGTPQRGSIILPLPQDGLKEATGISLSEENLGLVGGLFASGASATASGGLSGLLDQAYKEFTGTAKTFEGVTNDLSATIKATAGGVARYAGRRLPGGIGQGISVGTGVAANNFTALAFNNVSLRDHTFSWRFFPEDEEESRIITQIRNRFQVASHPSYTLGNNSVISRALLSYPNLVLPYILIDQSQLYYYQMKPCLISNVTFAYRADGGMALLKGGKPAVIEMSVTMKETSIWTAEDYSSGSSGAGGGN